MSFVYGSVALAAGSVALASEVGGEGTGSLVIGNESGFTVVVAFEGTSSKRTLYSGTVDLFDVPNGWNGNVTFTPTAQLNNTAQWPSSFAQIDVYGINERPSSSAYPLALNRASNIGNAVNTVGGVSSSIVNDNNIAGTSIVEATPTGDGASAVQLSNSGVLTLGNGTHKGAITVGGLLSANSTGQAISALNGTSTFQNVVSNGILQSNKTAGVALQTPATGTTSLDGGGITTDGGGVMTVTGLTVTGSETVQNNLAVNGHIVAPLTITGGATTVDSLAFPVGTFSRISKFTAAVTTTSTFFNHGLGVVPDLVFCIPDGSAAVTNRIVECEYSSLTSTQCKLTAGASFNIVGVAIKF